ncbi:MAG: S-layer homology domain-containing protein, partial [Oscillospiraceae bacterium]|nr:S-layer homology domain-containing protein [Oscillospiraceae bacterium]
MKQMTNRICSLLLTLVLFAGFLPVTTASAYTLEEKQEALVQTAWAYYDKGFAVQYDSTDLSIVPKGSYGPLRITHETPPEFATPDETFFSVCSDYAYQIYYDVFGYKLLKNAYSCWTGGLSRRVPGKDAICAYKYESSKDDTPREKAITEYCKHLQPGDIINGVSKIGGGGHAMVYVGDCLGNGKKYLLHCAGYKYNTQTGQDRPECHTGAIKEIPGQVVPCQGDTRYGGISLEPAEKYLQKRYSLANKSTVVLSIIRPLNEIGDDKYTLSPSAQARLQFPRLVINRTASGMRFRDVEAGSTVTLKVELTNNSKKAYSVPVKETVPEGVTFVQASEGANISGKDITWDVTLNAGETKVVSYDCTVTAKRGETVTFTGGSVSTIPSNTINIPIGGKHLTAAEHALLADIAAGKHKDLFRNVDRNIIPELVWQKVLNLNVSFPTPKEFFEETIESTVHKKKTVYALRSDLTGTAKEWRSMVVPELYGGFAHAEMDSHKRVLDLRCDYLRPGDVIYQYSNPAKPSVGQTLVYLGNNKFMRQTRSTGGAATATFFEWQKAHTFQLFYVLRPSLAYDDLHTLPAPAVPVDEKGFRFTDIQPIDWFYSNVRELASDGIIKGMTRTTFAPNGTLTYGQALKLIGMAVGEKEPTKSGAHWASGWLTLAKSKGWLASDVNLDGSITRLALCQIAAKAKGLTEQPAKNPFKDTNDKDVLALNKAKVIDGMTKTEFKPNELLTRAQISKIICALRD